MFNTAAGMKLMHVPYKGSTPGVIDLIGGQVQVMFTGIPSVLVVHQEQPCTRAGRHRQERTAALPDVPTVIESGVPGYVVSPWFGLLVPARTPHAIIAPCTANRQSPAHARDRCERFATEGVDPLATHLSTSARTSKRNSSSGVRSSPTPACARSNSRCATFAAEPNLVPWRGGNIARITPPFIASRNHNPWRTTSKN